MVLFNYAIREVTAKLVYYGPGLCGKTTNLQFIHEKLDPTARGKLLSLATDGDRTLFFDFLPIEMGSIGGYKVRFQLYTVPGQVHYNATRKLVLKGVDAVVFVADSQLSMVERNRESFENLIENLIENGYDPAKVPIAIQLNKRDLPNVASVGDLVAAMGVEGYPNCEAVANRGDGVFETLKLVVKLTLSRLRNQFDTGSAGGPERRETTPTPQAPPAPPPPPPPSVVFAPTPPPPVFVPPVFAPAESPPVAATPEPLAVPLIKPVVAADTFDEFDLEDFAEEPAAPLASEKPEVAPVGGFSEADDVLDLEADLESLMEGQFAPESLLAETDDAVLISDEEFAAVTPEPEAIGDDSWLMEAQAEPESELEPAPAPVPEPEPVREAPAEQPPPWALEMMEEVQRLRAENTSLRAALRAITALLERQIGVLQEGRDELGRHVGETPGESTP